MTITPQRLDELIELHKNDCSYFLNGTCMTRACLKRCEDDKRKLVEPHELSGCAAYKTIEALRAYRDAREDARWIPVGERLPPNSITDTYYVTVVDTDGERSQTRCDEWCYVNNHWWPPLRERQKIVAWRPLPAPYIEGKDHG